MHAIKIIFLLAKMIKQKKKDNGCKFSKTGGARFQKYLKPQAAKMQRKTHLGTTHLGKNQT